MSNKKTVLVKFQENNGDIHEVNAELGQSLMQAAVFNNVPGIEAECGGCCMCATCHLYLPDQVLDFIPEATEEEDEMLEETSSERTPRSRLSCQLVVNETFEGLTFLVPESQS